MGRPETDLAEDEISRLQAAERELETVRSELAVQVAARHKVQVRLEPEIAQRDRIVAAGFDGKVLVLLAEMRDGIAQRRVGNLNQPAEWPIQLEDHEDRTRN